MTDRLIDIEGLHAGYGGIPVVRDLTLHVDAGEVVALLGPNGAGKTTTLRTISGLLRPIEGISGLLERLANVGARIGVVSSKKTDYIELGLNRLGLGSWIDVLVGADNTQRHKPDPEPLLHAAGLRDAVPSRCVYVGDAVTDVVAGRAAGMATIAVTWGAATADHLADAGPTAVVSSVAELAAQLLIDSR